MKEAVKAPMAGKVISLLVQIGDVVNDGNEVAVIEAMKMELPIVSSASGKVIEIGVSAGQAVEADMTLVVIEG
ncbi:MAG: acetyl-CoA carboxylase biotin carboxyl carrier protein subunit [Deltaproteobacteria bacterium RBG_13_47_9]|nr:MAG: acetyl-CoA carboxylase biotin carboxyl carrier protein subunit [Deltaproteobacteria bacterium RBG_13_47_9]